MRNHLVRQGDVRPCRGSRHTLPSPAARLWPSILRAQRTAAAPWTAPATLPTTQLPQRNVSAVPPGTQPRRIAARGYARTAPHCGLSEQRAAHQFGHFLLREDRLQKSQKFKLAAFAPRVGYVATRINARLYPFSLAPRARHPAQFPLRYPNFRNLGSRHPLVYRLYCGRFWDKVGQYPCQVTWSANNRMVAPSNPLAHGFCTGRFTPPCAQRPQFVPIYIAGSLPSSAKAAQPTQRYLHLPQSKQRKGHLAFWRPSVFLFSFFG